MFQDGRFAADSRRKLFGAPRWHIRSLSKIHWKEHFAVDHGKIFG